MIFGRPSPSGHAVVLHSHRDRGEALARILRSAGHRVTMIAPGARVVPDVAEAMPDVILGSPSFVDPPLGVVVRSVRQVLGGDLPVLVIVDRANGHLVADDPDSLIDGDEMIREPVDPGELVLRVGGLLHSVAERRRLERRVQELLGLYRMSWAFSLAGGATPFFERLVQESAAQFGASKCMVLLLDTERRQMVARQPAFGFTAEQVARATYPIDGEARERWNFRKNGPLLSKAAKADTRLLPDLVAVLGLSAAIIAPLSVGTTVRGLLLVANRLHGMGFTEEDLGRLQAVAGQAAVAIQNLDLHEELRRANLQLKEYDRLKSEFVGMVAHDFRKPLTAIRGFAELVLEEPSLPVETRQEFMRTIMAETDALAAMANDTLLITRIETGQFSFHWSEIDVGPFILNLMPLGLDEHSVLMDVPATIPRITADRARLKQVLDNLIGNAIKYSPNGGTILVRCRERASDHVVFEVVDHGLGIPADQVDGLFQKFHRVRTEEHARIPGTGLGLYICRLIVERHGGRIWVESEPGQGSTFGFVIPRDARAPTSEPSRPDKAQNGASEDALREADRQTPP
jgi:signal transduction histidine kinase